VGRGGSTQCVLKAHSSLVYKLEPIIVSICPNSRPNDDYTYSKGRTRYGVGRRCYIATSISGIGFCHAHLRFIFSFRVTHAHENTRQIERVTVILDDCEFESSVAADG
jgi:hypothetical protein